MNLIEKRFTEMMEDKCREMLEDRMTIYLNAERHNNGIKIEVELRIDGQTISSDFTEFVVD